MVTSCNMRFGRQALPHVIVLADGSMHQIDDVAGDRWCMPVSFITAFFGEGRGGAGRAKNAAQAGEAAGGLVDFQSRHPGQNGAVLTVSP